MCEECPEMINHNDPVDFYNGPFSNFALSPILMEHPWTGVPTWYQTVEHWFAANKAANPGGHEEIRLAPSPGAAKHRGRTLDLRPDWEEVKYDVMLAGLRAKFAPGTGFAALLLSTGDREIREDSPTDREWGYRDGGKNLLGKALMQIRKELRRDG